MLVYVGICLILVCLLVVKTRYLILLGGLQQFLSGLLRSGRRKKKEKRKEEGEGEGAGERKGGGNPVSNLISMVPTNEDLRRYYFWENFRLGEIEKDRINEKRRVARLRTLFKAKFQGSISLMAAEGEWSAGHFLVLQSHRVAWWKSEKAFDNGEACLGQIHFSGHSGLAGLSPLDLRTLGKKELARCSCVFGRSGGRAVGVEGDSGAPGGGLGSSGGGSGGAGEQIKRLYLFKSAEEKEDFEGALLDAVSNNEKMD